jgi:drug/metabolite transporter (DMT)-like permease
MAFDGERGIRLIADLIGRYRHGEGREEMIGKGPVAGFVWVTAATAIFAGLATLAKAASQAGVHPFQVVFFRNLFAATIFMPLLLTRGAALFETGQLSLYGLRCSVMLASMLLWFTSLSLIPIGQLTAISYLNPIFGTLAAIVFLGEVVRARRWTAMAIGLVGAFIILRPTVTPLGTGHLCAVLAACTGGMAAVFIKQLTARDDPNKIVFLTHLIMVPLSLFPALVVWQWPPLSVLPLLVGMGVCATLGHLTLVRAFAAIDASLVLTFEFTKLPFAALLAYLAFGEVVDIWTWIGAFVIFGSAIYIARREASLKSDSARMAAKPR